MMLPRRTSLQLTPLFDMLLIVIFAQYLEVRETRGQVQQRAGAAIADLQNTRQQLQVLRAEELSLQLEMEIERGRRTAAESELTGEKKRLAQTQADLDRTIEQQRVVGELVAEMFQIPTADLGQLLESTRMPVLEKSPQEMQRLKDKFREFSLQRGSRMVEHLLSYEEIRKRCDVWELHIDAQGIATLTSGNRSTRIRIPRDDDNNINIDRLIEEVYAWYRSLPQLKSLVVILLTYDRSTQIAVTDAVRQALPRLVARMQADHLGQVRFEYADLGFRLE